MTIETTKWLTLREAAKILNVSAQKVYYASRIGILKANRKGASWVIHIDDIQEFKERYIRQKIKQEVV